MLFQKTLLAASIATLSLTGALAIAGTAAPRMAAPVAAATPQEMAGLMAQLAGADRAAGLDADHGYTLAARHPGAAGTRITRLNHTYKGVRVFGSDSVVVTDDAGNVLSASAADRRLKLGQGAANTLAATRAFDVTPRLSAQAAIDAVVHAVAPHGSHRVAPGAELIIYPELARVRAPGAEHKTEDQLNALDLVDQVTGYQLAWLVKTRMSENGQPVYRDTIVSARDGRTLAQWNALQNVAGVGHSLYSGDVPVETTLVNGVYQMRDPSRGTGGTFGGAAVSDAAHAGASSPAVGQLYANSTNVWGDGKPYTGGDDQSPNGQTEAVDAMWGLRNTYDLLKNTQGWSSLDGQNTATNIAVHVDTRYDNAYYDDTCKCLYIGDGNSYNNLSTLDVIGHELSHGVTFASSALTYSGESGGLNEAFSDATGEMVEAYGHGGDTGSVVPATGNDWMVGKEISPTGVPLRWMWKPSKDGMSPDFWKSTLGSLDIHYAAGPANRMYYFLSQGSSDVSTSEMYSPYLTATPHAMVGIGNDKAYRILFRANTTKFTSATNYADARSKMMQAATELYGAGSKEVIAVQRAFAAINVGADVVDPPCCIGIVSQPQSITVAAGATASFSVSASGGVTPYRYQWMRNGADIAGANSATYSFVAQSVDNNALFSVKVSDASPTGQTVTSSSAKLVVGEGLPNLITNGSFEGGTAGWTGTTSVIGSWSNEPAYNGTKYAYFGGYGRSATETLAQTVTIPAWVTAATLSFALHIDTAETSTSHLYDKLVVTVKNAAGTVLGTLGTFSNLNKNMGYAIKTFNMLPYKGKTVSLSFAMTEDASLQTSFVVDNVTMQLQ